MVLHLLKADRVDADDIELVIKIDERPHLGQEGGPMKTKMKDFTVRIGDDHWHGLKFSLVTIALCSLTLFFFKNVALELKASVGEAGSGILLPGCQPLHKGVAAIDTCS